MHACMHAYIYIYIYGSLVHLFDIYYYLLLIHSFLHFVIHLFIHCVFMMVDICRTWLIVRTSPKLCTGVLPQVRKASIIFIRMLLVQPLVEIAPSSKITKKSVSAACSTCILLPELQLQALQDMSLKRSLLLALVLHIAWHCQYSARSSNVDKQCCHQRRHCVSQEEAAERCRSCTSRHQTASCLATLSGWTRNVWRKKAKIWLTP